MRIILAILFSLSILGCASNKHWNVKTHEQNIAAVLDAFNAAAAAADYDLYFAFFSNDATFLGTDATEYWSKDSFARWAKPYFDKKKTWHFTSVQRHIYLNPKGDMAWFDELLSTQMKICRGSGVLIKVNKEWKIAQYVLSMTIPNDISKKVTELKQVQEDSLLLQINPH
jgi:ketosteroid isomerase-like protein